MPWERQRGGLWGDPELFSEDPGPRGRAWRSCRSDPRAWRDMGARARQRPSLERVVMGTALCPPTQLQRSRIIFLPTQPIFLFWVPMLPKWPKLNLVPELCLSSGCHGLSVWGNWLLEILHEVGKDLLVHPSSSPTLSCRPIEAAAGKPHAPIPWLALCYCCIMRSVAQSLSLVPLSWPRGL